MLRRKRTVLLALIAALAFGGGTALAAWLVSGTGPGTAKAITAVSLSVTTGTSTASLYPGATSAVHATVSNPIPFRST